MKTQEERNKKKQKQKKRKKKKPLQTVATSVKACTKLKMKRGGWHLPGSPF